MVVTSKGSNSSRGVAVSADGRRAVSASWYETLKVWNVEMGRALRNLGGQLWVVRGVAVRADGRRAVSASDDRTLKLWDLDTGVLIATFTCDAAVFCCSFIGDTKLIAGDAGGRVHLLSLEEP